MKKNIKIMLFILIIILIFIVFMIISLSKNTIKDNPDIDEEILSDNNGLGEVIIKEELQPIYAYGSYYMLEQCISNYTNSENKESLKKAGLIEESNIIDLFNNKPRDNQFKGLKMYMLQRDEFITTYFCYGKLNYIYDIYSIINIDSTNCTFEIQDIKYFNNMSIEEIEQKIQQDYNKFANIKNTTRIEKNNYNEYKITGINKEGRLKRYFEDYKEFSLNNIEVVYNLLDEEYKKKRFGNIDNFKNYITQNQEKIAGMKLEKYAEYKNDNYIQYVCLDNNGDYYIFNEIRAMDYKILLDTYTIDQPVFIEKYESADESQKAGYNINKFIQAVNAKDYNYAYNCLANSFKQNKFQTLQSFENYIKNNLFNNNEVEFENGRQEGNYYIYTLKIIDKNNPSTSIQKEFIINLKENREFEMSFEV